MLPTFHFFFTFILWFLLRNYLGLKTNFSLIAMMLSGFLIDFDIIFYKEHRKAFTHTIPFWALIAIIISYFNLQLSILVFVSAVGHLFTDCIDWHIYLFYPFSKKPYGLGIVARRNPLDPKTNSVFDFIKANLREKRIMFLELTIDTIGTVLLLYSLSTSDILGLLFS